MKKHYLTLLLTILLAVAASAQTPTSLDLRHIITDGTEGEFYTITNTLYGVYVSPRYKNVVFAKDNKANPHQSKPNEDQIFDEQVYDNYAEFDQSNWIQILFPNGYDASGFQGKQITKNTITGRVNVVNTIPNGPVGLYIEVEEDNLPTTGSATSYEGNLYCCANFVQQQWFFVKPKNLEYANIRWAVYKGKENDDYKFYVPHYSKWPGSFKVDMALWEEQTADNSVTPDDVFQPGEAYQFPAIIEFSTDNQLTLDIDPGFSGDNNYDKASHTKGIAVGQPGTLPESYKNVVVYPLRLPDDAIITAVEQVETANEVESVQYFDLQGRMSNAPLKGMNIKVTTYTDGTTTRQKLIH